MMITYCKRCAGLLGAVAVALSIALPVQAQTRGGGGGGFGGGGFGGGGFGGGGRGTAGTSANATSRQYPANGTIPDAYFSIDPETRRVVVIAPEEAMGPIMNVLTNLDRPKPQVLIKVVFLEVSLNNALDIGIEGGWEKSIGNNNSANAANVFGMSGLNSATSNLNFNAVGQPISSFQSTASSVAGGNAGLYQMMGQNWQATLRAIQQVGTAKILSRPSILARNNQPAQVMVGQQVPLISSVSYNGLNGTPINAFTYQNVGVILNVTPFITSDNAVEMIVNPVVSSIDPTISIPIAQGVTAPVIDTRSANTVAVTPDGVTVVLGGLMQSSKNKTENKIPLLGDIPVLGNLFKRTITSDVRTELIIFLTPYIVQNPSELASLSARERARSEAPGAFSEKELNKFLDGLPMKDAGPNPPGKRQK